MNGKTTGTTSYPLWSSSTTTTSTPRHSNLFLLDTRQIPHMGFKPNQNPSGLEMVNELTERIKSATEEAKLAICKAQEDITRYYN